MKRVWEQLLVAAAALTAGGITVSACVHDDSSMFVAKVIQPLTVTAGQACQYTGEVTQPSISSGVLDIDFRHQYDAVFLVGNQLVPRGNPDQTRTETSRINVQGAIVRITDAAGHQLKEFTRLTSGTIDPATGTTPSYQPVFVTIIDHGTLEDSNSFLPDQTGNADAYNAQICGGNANTNDPCIVQDVYDHHDVIRLVTYVRFFGQTLGGQHVESNEFEFPVDICRGCLIQFTPADVDPTSPVQPNCRGNSAAGNSSSGATLPEPCIPGQDLLIDCQQCPGLPDCRGAVFVGGGSGDAGGG